MNARSVEETASEEAFPRPGCRGLSKREYIAALALQGILAKAYNDATFEGAARDAIVHADALIERLARPKGAFGVGDDD